MAKKHRIEFLEQSSPLHGHVTKFGGQPDWVTTVEWPLSRATGEPMRFICQIALVRSLFGNGRAEMAYLFMTDDEIDFVDGTHDPDSGENAVILQPGTTMVPTKPLNEGPTLYRMIKSSGGGGLEPEICQFAVAVVEFAEDEPLQDEIKENKIGGRPVFLQGEEYPFDEKSRLLLLQLDSCSVPFFVNFGDAGVGYAFLDESGGAAKFLWQCA